MIKKFLRLVRYDWPMHFVLLLTNWLPDNVIFLRLRGWLASHFLGSCGKNLRLGRNITFYNPSQISIGSDVYVAYGCWFMADEQIVLEDEVILGPYCVVVSAEHGRDNNSFRHGKHKAIPTGIRRGVWLGSHVTITAGAMVGEGALIAANAVVTGEIPPNVLAAGQPATVVKHFQSTMDSPSNRKADVEDEE